MAGEQPAADLEAADDAAQLVGERDAPRRRCRRRARRGADPSYASLAASTVRSGVERADEIGDARDAGGAACSRVDAVEQLRPDERIDEVRRADLHGRRAGDHELERVARVGDAAHADDRNLHRLAALVDHAHGDRPDRRTAQAADAVRDLRPPRLDVDDHRQERVDERHGIGAGLFGRARERGDVGDVRRQLRNERQARHLAHGADDVVRAAQAAAELDAAFLDVRARDVQLDRARRLRRPTGSATPRRTRRASCRRR